MNKKISTVVVAALSTGLLVTGLAPAFAHQDGLATAESSITMAYKARKDKMVGTVSSTRAQCASDRTVKVYRIRQNGRTMIGTATTNAEGRWQVPLTKADGRYGARATLKSVTLDSGSDSYGNLWKHLLQCTVTKTVLKA